MPVQMTSIRGIFAEKLAYSYCQGGTKNTTLCVIPCPATPALLRNGLVFEVKQDLPNPFCRHVYMSHVTIDGNNNRTAYLTDSYLHEILNNRHCLPWGPFLFRPCLSILISRILVLHILIISMTGLYI